MKKYLFILLTTLFFSCQNKEVELQLIDILTAGDTKTWKIESFKVDGEELMNAELYPFYENSRMVFYKRQLDPNDETQTVTPLWHWQCLNPEFDNFYFFRIENGVLIQDNSSEWHFEEAKPNRVILFSELPYGESAITRRLIMTYE